jgi:hypothetical protein
MKSALEKTGFKDKLRENYIICPQKDLFGAGAQLSGRILA